MKKYAFLFLLFFIAPVAWAQSGSFKKEIINEFITVSMPKTFRPMTDDEVVAEYAVYRKPLAMYRDDQAPVHLGVNMSASRWENKDMVILKSFYKATLLDLYSDINFIQDTLITQGDYQYAVFEFTSVVNQTEKEAAIITANPIRKYTYIQYTVANGNVMIFNFSCSIRDQQRWAATAKEIMDSIDIK